MKKYIILLLFITATSIAHAQRGNSLFSVNYHMAVPIGDFKDYLDQTSFRGFSADYRYLVTDKIALGLQSGYHVFNEKVGRQTYFFESGAATLTHWRFAHVVPILVVAHYDFMDEDSKIKISAGLGLGPYFVRQEVWIGLYTIQEEQWGFGLAPEVMVRYNFTDTFGMLFAPRYEVVFGAERAHLDGTENNLSFWDFRFGFFFEM